MFTNWRKSTKSLHNPEQCIEVGTAPNMTGVRDTKDRDGGLLSFTNERWADFLAAVKANKFNA
ncbi:DUF397 domain-containing protein [Saccharopolyspora sp. NPDC002376]